MFIGLMMIEFILIFSAVFLFSNGKQGLRGSFIVATVLFSVLVVAITEVLSLFSWFAQKELVIAWLLSIFATIGILFFIAKKVRLTRIPVVVFPKLDRIEKILLVVIGIFFAVTACNALIFLPTNWDSMAYHLGRVANWTQNRTVDHYATSVLRQLSSSVFAEYVIFHTYVLSDGDRCANLVQWFYYIASTIAVTGIAKRLGLSFKGQILSAFIFASAPMAIMQASSTQNDMVASFWTISFVYFFLNLIKREKLYLDKAVLAEVCMMAFCAALGLMTKSTAVMAMLPFFVYLLIDRIHKKDKIFPLVVLAICAVILVVVMNGGYFYRNYATFGNILASNVKENESVLSKTANPLLMSMNILKNTLMEMDIPITVGGVAVVDTAVSELIDFLNAMFDLEPNEPTSSFNGISFYMITGLNHHDTSGDPIPVILGLLSAALVIFHYKKIPRSVLLFAVTSTCSFLLIACLVKWQPWITRLLLPSIGLLSVSSVAVMSTLIKGKVRKIFRNGMIAVCLIGSIFPLALNKGQTLALGVFAQPFARDIFYSLEKYAGHIGMYQLASERMDYLKNDKKYMYFWCNPAAYDDYRDMLQFVDGLDSREIGLIMGKDFVYPLFAYAKENDIVMRDVMVKNESNQYEDGSFTPDCLLFISREEGASASIVYNGSEYICIKRTEAYSVFTRTQ